MGETTVSNAPWRIVTPSELRGRRRVAGKGLQWAKLQRMEATLSLLQKRLQSSPQELASIDNLLERLEMARSSIRVNSTLFWSIVHEVSADMLLVMPADMLAAEAMDVEHQFRQNIVNPEARVTWLGKDERSGPLPEAVRQVAALAREPAPQGTGSEAQLYQARYVLRGALRLVNENTDLAFQRLNLTMLIRGLSGILLITLFVLAFLFNRAVWLVPPDEGGEALWKSLARLLSLVMLGAGGAIVANMLSELPALVVNGPRWRQYLFYLFVRPSLGAFAAFLFYLLARSKLLFSIEDSQGGFNPSLPPAIRIMLSTREAVGFAYALISLAVGFSAERILGSTMDQVLNKLFTKAEKTVPTPSAPPPEPAPAPVPRASGGEHPETDANGSSP